MNSNIETPTNHADKKRIKPENYTQKMYDYFRLHFTANLAYITDNGRFLETTIFFDLCSENIEDAPWYIPEMEIWFAKRKQKIKSKKTYQSKKKSLKEFFTEYNQFFDIPTTNLS